MIIPFMLQALSDHVNQLTTTNRSGLLLPAIQWRTLILSNTTKPDRGNKMKDIKQIKKHLGIGNKDIAKAFGYKNQPCYANSSAKKRIEKGIEYIFNAANKRK